LKILTKYTAKKSFIINKT